LPSWIRIRISNLYADPDPAAQINADPDTDPDPKPWFILNETQEFRLVVNVKYYIFFCQDLVKISDLEPGSFPFGKKTADEVHTQRTYRKCESRSTEIDQKRRLNLVSCLSNRLSYLRGYVL
jgi:hypothetical protein